MRQAGGAITEVPGGRGVPGIVASGAGIHAALLALARAPEERDNALD